MKLTTSSLALLAFSAQHVSAFPAILSEAMIQIRGANEAQARDNGVGAGCPYKREANAEAAACPMKRQAKGIIPPFDAAQQYVSNTGEHAFVPPSGNDQRGPCGST